MAEDLISFIVCNYAHETFHPGLAEIFAPHGVSGSDIMENFRQYKDNRWVQDGSKTRCKMGSYNMFTKISKWF